MDIFTSDNHLTPYLYSPHYGLYGDAYFSFSQIVNYAIENKIEAVHIGGDLLDTTNPKSNVIKFLLDELDKLHQNKITINIINGNHDRPDPLNPPWFKLCPFVNHVDEKEFEVCGLPAWGIDYNTPSVLLEKLADVPPHISVLMLHQFIDEAANLTSHLTKKDLSLGQLPDFLKLVLLGDVHKTWDKVLPNGCLALYNGSTALRTRSEQPDKYFTLLSNKSNSISYSRIKLHTRPFLLISINSVEEESKFFDTTLPEFLNTSKEYLNTYFPPHISKPHINVCYSVELLDFEKRIRSVINEQACLRIEPVYSNISNKPVISELTELRQSTINDCIDSLKDQKETDILEMTKELVNSSSVEETLSLWRDRFKV